MFMKDLLVLNPKIAAIFNRIGCFPLSISTSHQHDFISIKIVLDAVPEVGTKADAINRLLPLMSATVGN